MRTLSTSRAILLTSKAVPCPGKRDLQIRKKSLQRRLTMSTGCFLSCPPGTCLRLPFLSPDSSLLYHSNLNIFMITTSSSLSSPHTLNLLPALYSAAELSWATPMTQLTYLGVWPPFIVMPNKRNQNMSCQNSLFHIRIILI